MGHSIIHEQRPFTRRLRYFAKMLARIGFVAVMIAGAPQLRAAVRAGVAIDWTFLGPALVVFSTGLAVMCLFCTLDSGSPPRRRPSGRRPAPFLFRLV